MILWQMFDLIWWGKYRAISRSKERTLRINMSGYDLPEGPDWWQASDGKWYPPELRSQSPSLSGSSAQQPIRPATPPITAGQTSGVAAYGPGAAPAHNPGRGFFERLFDTSFSEFITPSIIKVLFIVGSSLSALFGLVVLFVGLAGGTSQGAFFGLIVGPSVALLGIIYTRVLLELVMVLFRIEANTR
jgi:hypothetical protein